MTRNKFVLVDKQFMVTATDLLKLLQDRQKVNTIKPQKVVRLQSKPMVINDKDEEEDTNDNNVGMKLAAAAIGGMGIAATATYLIMKQQN